MKKICFITGTRADYGIMAPVMRQISDSDEAVLQVIATNMHLSAAYGMTVNEIEADGFKVDRKIESLGEGDSPADIVRSMAKVEIGLADAFEELQPDLVVVLGDRYEALAAAAATVVFGIPLMHLHGGEITEGAFDDMFRNAITKLATYHFASTPEYARRIVSMGENQRNVFHSGAPGAEMKELPQDNQAKDFYQKTGLRPDDRFLIVTMHPATLSEDGGMQDIENTISALQAFVKDGYKILITLPNSDPGNKKIRKLYLEWAAKDSEMVKCVESLGSVLFHYALNTAQAIVGNSSSALIEAPSYRLPAVNIGIRQKGRAQGPSVINAEGNAEEIGKAITKALTPEFREGLKEMKLNEINPYYKEGSSKYIADKLLKL